MNNQSRKIRPSLIDVNPNEYNQGLRYNPFMVNLDRCDIRCYTFDDPSDAMCVPNRTEDVNLSVFSIITRTN